MKKQRSFMEKISSGKGFYITAALSFVSIVIAIAFVYNSSMDMISDLDIPTVTTSRDNEAVEVTKEDIPDPRNEIEATTEFTETITETEIETSPIFTTTKAADGTTETTKQTVPPSTETFVNTSFSLPVNGEVIKEFSSDVPVYDETMGDWRTHRGIDFLAEQETAVVSVGNGKVTKVISDPSWGFCIEVDYGSFIARYCGLAQGTTVSVDTVLQKGQTIGTVGVIPCEAQMESHIHFEVIVSGENVDPLNALNISN